MGNRFCRTGHTPKIQGIGVAFLAGVVCFLAGGAATVLVGNLAHEFEIVDKKREAEGRLSGARARLEGEFGRLVAFGTGLRGFIAQQRGNAFSAVDYENIAAEIMLESPAVKGITLAPGNVVKGIYPLGDNDRYLGFDYRKEPEVWQSVQLAMETRQPVIVGPVTSRPGVRVMKIRLPIYNSGHISPPLAAGPYWGTATMAVDDRMMLTAAGIRDSVKGYKIAIFSRGSSGQASSFLFGDPSIAAMDSVSVPLHLPGGTSWELLAYPENGWTGQMGSVWTTEIVGILVSLIVGILVVLLINEIYKTRALALHDPLTGLANRRLLEDRLSQLLAYSERSGGGFSIFYIDIDGFKPINDLHGHAAGDDILVEVGRNLTLQTRQTDTVARVGGDEFIVLTPNKMTDDEIDVVKGRLKLGFNKVHSLFGKTIPVTGSIGTAVYPQDGKTIDELLKVADENMYAQKKRPVFPETGRAEPMPAYGTG